MFDELLKKNKWTESETWLLVTSIQFYNMNLKW